LVQDFLLFEGNAQTLRIVAKLQVLADFQGLNLTFGTLSALCKYTASSVEVGKSDDHAKSKTGYFTSEKDRVQIIREKTGTGDARNPITFLVEAADDIVYSVADIEDGVKKRILSWHELNHLLGNGPKASAAASTVQAVLANKKAILNPNRNPDLLPDDIHCAAFRTAAISILVKAAADVFQQNYGDIMSGTFTGEERGELVGMGTAAPFIKLLKSIGRTKIYCTHSNLKLELLGRKVIKDLLTLFWEGAAELNPDSSIIPKNFTGKLQALLSDSYRKVFSHFAKEGVDLPIAYHRFQLVTDYVCGMTDSFAKRLHSELTNG
jgi:dGTPase